MKKGVVLLISLFFITAISVLVLKNLDDSDKILEQRDYKLSLSQALILTKNIKNEIKKIINKEGTKIDEYIQNGYFNSISFGIEGIKVTSSLKEYEKKDMNQLGGNYNKEDLEEEDALERYLQLNDIYDYALLEDIYKESIEENTKLESSKQVKRVIDKFIENRDSNNIEKIEENLGFFNSKEYYSLSIKVSFLNEFLNSYYVLNKTGGVEYFETSFK
ncbi:hypothetical protein [Halarcobacter anaerophilus]|uniref:hypothetical protein n=1 Tax=Halarcobacter anaerophilus TaxID=877500 RepID=UPI0005CADDD2|nr:hypothetical protein [Halarcobacter anaerophilus]